MPSRSELVEELRGYSHGTAYRDLCDGIFARAADALEALQQDSSTGQEMHAHWQARAEAAEAERDDLADRLAVLLDNLTDSRMSGTGYDVPTMVAEVEAAFERGSQAEIQVYADAVTEALRERDEWKARAEAAEAALEGSEAARLAGEQKLAAVQAERDAAVKKLEMPCGSCHPCTEWANQTWINAGLRLPHVIDWQEVVAERDALQARITELGQILATCKISPPARAERVFRILSAPRCERLMNTKHHTEWPAVPTETPEADR